MMPHTPTTTPETFMLLPDMIWLIAMPLISWLTSLGIFCKTSELEKLRASIAERYMPREEYTQDLRLIREELQHLSRHINKLIPKIVELLDKQPNLF
jgi:hypothetical protein